MGISVTTGVSDVRAAPRPYKVLRRQVEPELICSGPSWILARVRSRYWTGLKTGHLGHQCSHAAGRPNLPRLILSQTSAGKSHHLTRHRETSVSGTWRAPCLDAPSQLQLLASGETTRAGLRELGYVEGRDIRLEFRNAAGNVDALPALAQEIVRDGGVDAILAIGTPAALAAYKATQTIPIVAFGAVDPVRSGLADSLAHPGRNVTGITVFAEETTAKRVELMREVVPRAVRLGTVTTKGSKGAQSLAPVLEIGRKLGFTVEPINLDDLADLAKALSPEVLAGFDAFVFIPDAVLNAHMAEIITIVGLSRKPAILPDWVANGGFMSFGPDFSELIVN
jgi:ABC-type uncharacterized transport system substrate-binding protein